jgi:hypothetical protein
MEQYNSTKITKIKKETISKSIKNISLDDVEREWTKLVQIGTNASTISPRSRIGNNIVDYFTFTQRLETKGKYNITFFEFVEKIDEFKQKKFISNMLEYYEKVKTLIGLTFVLFSSNITPSSSNISLFFINSFPKGSLLP